MGQMSNLQGMNMIQNQGGHIMSGGFQQQKQFSQINNMLPNIHMTNGDNLAKSSTIGG